MIEADGWREATNWFDSIKAFESKTEDARRNRVDAGREIAMTTQAPGMTS